MEIRIIHWHEAPKEVKEKILRRAQFDISAILPTVEAIVAEVRKRGDRALLQCIEKFDGVSLKPEQLKVTEEEFVDAEQEVEEKYKIALQRNVENIRKFHRQQIPPPMTMIPISPGVYAGEHCSPLDSVALYVPRGKGSFPSVLYMLAVPAVLAGVGRIIVATPPSRRGQIDAGTLYAARMCGVHEVYKIGGAQAIAALAYGTETIPKVVKIIGPGSAYVTAAKRLLYGVVDVGPPAGPSEAVILADEMADPDKLALDFLIEAEHGPDSASILVVTSEESARRVAARLPALVKKLPEMRSKFIEENMQRYSGIVVVDDLNEAVEFINEYAPEHLQIATESPFDLLLRIRNAGEVLLGQDTPFSLANFSIGPNAVLPTGGFAKSFAAVSVRDFCKCSSIGYVTRAGLRTLKEQAIELADYEGFPAHAAALRERG